MKKIHIVALIMAVVGVVMLLSASKDLSTYATFGEAQKVGKAVKVVGVLAKDLPMVYNPEEDPNLFTFHMRDQDGVAKRVLLNEAKPQDFELSEQIVVTGRLKGGDFVASSILLKCPSKYKDQELATRNDI
ncbi:MAG: cytochrome c maturation protein CcmE [Saprospiraceae bacterium]|nr:cytochrome c maturation protein CcmE [Saprospiraceae bacterium]